MLAGGKMKTLLIASMIVVTAFAFIGVALTWITLLEAAGAVAVGLVIVLVTARLREGAIRVPSDDEGQRHHRGRGGGGLM